VTTIPTVGFNVETVNYKNVKFSVWVSSNQNFLLDLLFVNTFLGQLSIQYIIYLNILLYSHIVVHIDDWVRN